MQSINEDLKRKSAEFGADDIAFVNSDDTALPCVIMLFFRYLPSKAPSPGMMALSSYYIASNKGYHAAKKLTQYILEKGFFAKQDTMLSAKEYALKSGGFIGGNGFYYHKDFGSLISIQTILTDAAQPQPGLPAAQGCLECGACEAACPSSAVGNITQCLRYHSNLTVPEHLRGGLYQLLGCELCQTACPLNNKQKQPPVQFETKKLLSGYYLKELQEIAGKNMARKQRIISQAALYSANTMQKDTAAQLKTLSQNAPSPVNEHAAWALERIEETQ